MKTSPGNGNWLQGALLLTTGLAMLSSCGEDKEALPPVDNPMAQTVKVSAVVAREEAIDGEELLVTGSLVANEAAEIYPEQSGIITGIRFTEGTRVSRGQVLATVNNAELRAQYKSLQSDLQLARDIESRQQRLLEIGGISQQEYDAARNNRVAMEARIEELDARLRQFNIRAPFSGTIGLRFISEGAYVTPATRLASLVDMDPIKLDFSVPGKYFNQVKPGDKVTFTAEGSAEPREATVYAIEPVIDAATRSLLVRARADNSGDRLLPGAFAEVRMRVGQGRQAVMIPTEALIMERDSQRVYVIRDGRADLVNIQTGVRREQEVEITSGVADGDSVVTRGILLLRPGAAVQVERGNGETTAAAEAGLPQGN